MWEGHIAINMQNTLFCNDIADTLRRSGNEIEPYTIDSPDKVVDECKWITPFALLMEVANPSDGSPVSFLSVMLFRALCALDKGIDRPFVAHVQHQYRAAINAPLNRHSLVTYIPASIVGEERYKLCDTKIPQ